MAHLQLVITIQKKAVNKTEDGKFFGADYGTANQTSNYLSTFSIPSTGGLSAWGWQQLKAANGSLLKLRFDGSQTTLQLIGGPTGRFRK